MVFPRAITSDQYVPTGSMVFRGKGFGNLFLPTQIIGASIHEYNWTDNRAWVDIGQQNLFEIRWILLIFRSLDSMDTTT